MITEVESDRRQCWHKSGERVIRNGSADEGRDRRCHQRFVGLAGKRQGATVEGCRDRRRGARNDEGEGQQDRHAIDRAQA